MSPLTRARAHGALLGLLCGARVAASMKPGTPDPNRYLSAWQPEVDQRAAEMGLGPAPPTEMHLRDSFRAALVGAHTIIKNGAYRAEEMLAAYRRAEVYIEPTEHESNWFLPRLIPVMLFAHGIHRVISADVDIDRYVSDEEDESADRSKRPREASAISEFLAIPHECVDAEIALTHRISFKTSATLRQLLFGMQRLLLSDREDPLAGIRFHRSFDPEREVGFQWESDRRGGHLYLDQVAPFFNAPLDELPPQVSNPQGPDDADLPPLPREVGMGIWGDPMGKRGGEVTLGDRTQPPLQEPLHDMSFFDFGPRQFERPSPDEATGDFSVSATIENVWYHLAQTLSLLSAVRETMRLRGNTIVPTAMVASVIGGIHDWRAIPHTWITAIDTTELSFTGIAGKDLMDSHVAEALIQTGYRWGCRRLHDRGVDVSRLERKPAPASEENADEY